MNSSIKFLTAVASLTLMGNALAQSIAIPTTVVEKGNSAPIDMAYTAGNAATNLDFILNYDDAVVDEATLAIDCSVTIPELTALNCSVDTTLNQIKGIGVNFGSTPLSSTDPMAVITLPVLAGAATGNSVQNFVANYFDVTGGSVGVQNGTWTVTVSDGPQPDYSSNPTPASGVTLTTIQNTGDPSTNVDISNLGEAGSTLTGTCTETSDPDNLFSLSGDTSFSVVAGPNADAVVVTCDSAGSIGTHSGEMSCTHNGSGNTESSPAVYALSCRITTGPQSAYSDTLAPDPMVLAAVEEGDADPTGTVTVTNTGDLTTTLAGACTYSGDTEMSIANGAFSLGKGVSQIATLTCDASAEGTYSGTISCAHDAGNVSSPVTHAATCTVGPPGPAKYASVPVPGSTIDMTPGDNPPAGTPVADKALAIANAATDPNDRDLELLTCGYTGSPEITATAPGSMTLAPTTGTSVTFSCDSTTAGTYTGTYSCEYDESGNNEPDGTASYTVNCDVRTAASDIKENPMSGTPLSIAIPQFGTGQTSVSFTEILEEGVTATIDSCSFADGISFSVVTALPLNVASGATVQVVVQGQDPADGSVVVNDTLTCLYTDSDSTPGTASWPITLNIQTAAIPTLSAWGLMAMILTMLGLGGIVIRRKTFS